MPAYNLPGIDIRIAGRRKADARTIASGPRPFGELQGGTQLEKALPAEEELYNRILSFDVTERDFGSNELTLTLDNRDLKLFGATTLEASSRGQLDIFHNAVWLVRLGYPNDALMGREMAFVVNQIKGFRVLTLRAYEDSFIRLDSTAKHRVWRSNQHSGVRRSAVARAIAKEHGLNIPEGGVKRTSGSFQKIVQAGITDAALLTRMAKAAGYIWWMEPSNNSEWGRQFHFRPRDFYSSSTRFSRYNIGVDQFVIRDFMLDTNIFQIPRTALASALDPFEAIRTTYRAGNDTTKRQVSGNATPLDPSLLAASGLSQQKKDEASVMWASSGAGAPTGKRLQEDLDGLWKTFESSMIKAKLTLLGDPTITARSGVWLEGIGQVGGYYYVKQVRHLYRSGGMFETVLDLRKNAFEHIELERAKVQIMSTVRNRLNPENRQPDNAGSGPNPDVAVHTQQMGDSPDADRIAAMQRVREWNQNDGPLDPDEQAAEDAALSSK